MGVTGSKLEKSLGTEFPESERYFGLENFGNTCYCNSVLQSLYFCLPFRQGVLNYFHQVHNNSPPSTVGGGITNSWTGAASTGFGFGMGGPKQEIDSSGGSSREEDSLFFHLAELFYNVSTQKKRSGYLEPKKFIIKLRQENDLFRSMMHQDAHEFLNYLLNVSAEFLQKKSNNQNGKTFIHDIFEGTLTNETKCLSCESVSSKDESFLDLSLEIFQNSSITHCLRNFSATETLSKGDKFYCDTCCSLQEARKRMRLKKLPNILVVHLKRFKYIEQIQRYKKLSYRVAFPFELKLSNTSDDATDPDRSYNLFAVVVHVGSGPNHGHYFSFIKSHNKWLHFDDREVMILDELRIQSTFGSPNESSGPTDCGYLLFYQSSTPLLVSSSSSLTPSSTSSTSHSSNS